MYCQKCGSQIADDAEFCPKCGNKIKGKDSSTVSTEKKADTVMNTVQAKDNKKVKIALIAIVAVAILGILIKCIGGIVGKTILSNYKQCPDLEVVATTVDDANGYFVVKNIGSQVIKDFTIAYVGYDVAGNVIDLGYNTTYETCDFTSANIMPDSVYGLDKYVYIGKRDVKFIDAMISSVTYKDGTTWGTEGLDAWAKDVSDEFSVEEYKNKVENMKSDAILAESNPYIEITGTAKFDDNKFSNSDDFEISVINIGDKTVKKFSVIVLQYDGNGYAAGVNFGFVVSNADRATVDPANLDAGQKGGWNWSLFFDADCKTYKTLIYDIEFKDGTTWTNEYALQWMLYNEDER